MDRANRFLSHLSAAPTAASSTPRPTQSPDDVVIVSALRTALQPARRGLYKDSLVPDLVIPVVKATLERTKGKVDPAELGDVVTGVVLGDGSFTQSMVRAAALAAGVPYTVPLKLVNRQCGSGLEAIANIADAIRAGHYEVGLAVGVESMSSAKFKPSQADFAPALMTSPLAMECAVPMGGTAEALADKYKVTREEMDAFAVESHRRAAAAQKAGWSRDEIIPVTVTVKDKEGNARQVTVTEDGGIRPSTSMETLGKLKTVFRPKGGRVTAGTSSQVTDGAAAVMLCKRSYAQRKGLTVLGALRSSAVIGCRPMTMGEGASLAIPPTLKRAGLAVPDIDLFEVNAAFAPVPIVAIRNNGLDRSKVNVSLDAISVGHPLGATGCRMIVTMLNQLKRTGGTYGLVSACIGSGAGIGAVISRE